MQLCKKISSFFAALYGCICGVILESGTEVSTRVGICPGQAVKVPWWRDLLDEVKRVQEVFRDAHEGKEDGWNSNLYEQCCPASSSKRVPCFASSTLQQKVLPQHSQKLPAS